MNFEKKEKKRKNRKKQSAMKISIYILYLYTLKSKLLNFLKKNYKIVLRRMYSKTDINETINKFKEINHHKTNK